MRRRRGVWRAVRTAAAFGTVATVTVALAQQSASGAFSAVSGSTGNQVSSAAEFCSAPDTKTLNLADQVNDTYVNESNPGANYGSVRDLYVRSQSGGNARALVRFPTLPPLPAGCTVTSATFQMTVGIFQSGRTIGVHRTSPTASWSASTVTWTSQPATTGEAPVTGSPTGTGSQAWDVTALVRAQYAEGNSIGFLVRDQHEGALTPTDLRYRSEEDGFRPELTVSWS